MNEIAYIQINLIPIAVLIIMRINTRETLSYTWRNHALRFIMVLSAAIMAIDATAWMLNGKQFAGANLGLWIFDTAYFALMPFIAYLWFLYVKDSVEDGLGQRGKIVVLPSLPLMLYDALLILNLWNHELFYIDENNYYVRGRLFAICMISGLFYVIWASGLAIVSARNAVGRDVKRQYRLLAAFAILPMTAGVLQCLAYGVAFQWPFTAASLVMVYINVQREQVIRDGLTGLNNRRRLDQYLESLEPWQEKKENWYLMVMDLDKFKKINDTYGHVTGDVVLKLVAAQLKKIFGDSRAFLARYGGDEFVVVMKCKNEQELEKRMAQISNGLAGIKWGDESAWTLEVSIGCAKYDRERMHETDEWFALADERMYQQKNSKNNS